MEINRVKEDEAKRNPRSRKKHYLSEKKKGKNINDIASYLSPPPAPGGQ